MFVNCIEKRRRELVFYMVNCYYHLTLSIAGLLAGCWCLASGVPVQLPALLQAQVVLGF